MRLVKNTFDADGILNPGKIFPDPERKQVHLAGRTGLAVRGQMVVRSAMAPAVEKPATAEELARRLGEAAATAPRWFRSVEAGPAGWGQR